MLTWGPTTSRRRAPSRKATSIKIRMGEFALRIWRFVWTAWSVILAPLLPLMTSLWAIISETNTRRKPPALRKRHQEGTNKMTRLLKIPPITVSPAKRRSKTSASWSSTQSRFTRSSQERYSTSESPDTWNAALRKATKRRTRTTTLLWTTPTISVSFAKINSYLQKF